jgi:hypothetical protein
LAKRSTVREPGYKCRHENRRTRIRKYARIIVTTTHHRHDDAKNHRDGDLRLHERLSVLCPCLSDVRQTDVILMSLRLIFLCPVIIRIHSIPVICVRLSPCLPGSLYRRLSLSVSGCLPVCLSACLPACLSSMSVCLSIPTEARPTCCIHLSLFLAIHP